MTVTGPAPVGTADTRAGDVLEASALRLHPGVSLGPAVRRGPRTVHLVHDARAGRTYEVGTREHFVFSRLDGRRDRDTIDSEYQDRFRRRLDEQAWRRLGGLLYARRLLVSSEPAPAESPEVSPSPSTPAVTTEQDAMRGRRSFGDPSRMLSRVDRVLGRRTAAVLGALAVVLAVAGQVDVWTHARALDHETVALVHRPLLIVVAVLVLWASLMLHEFAHGLVGTHVGARATEIGVSWRFPAMALYCTVSDLLLVHSRRARVATAVAGVVTNLLVLAPFAAVWFVVRPTGDAGDLVGGILLVGSIAALLNLLPLFGLDGARALGHALGVADISAGGRAYLTASMTRDRAARTAFRSCPRWLRVTYLAAAALEVAVLAAVVAGVVVVVLLAAGVTTVVVLVPSAAAAALAVLGGTTFRLAHAGAPTRPKHVPAHRASEKKLMSVTTTPTAAVPAPLHASSPQGPPDADQRIVDVAGLTKTYGPRIGLDDVSLQVRPGEFFGILGPNGAGKTTLIEILEGLREPDGGTVRVLGRAPTPRDRALLRHIGVQRQASAFFPRLTAREHLRTVAALYGADSDAAEQALAAVGLTAVADTQAEKLSGGQRQRLAIASALAHGPDLVFLDEPTAALDPHGRRELWQLLSALKADGRTIIYTTHHLDEAEALCDRVAILERGRVIAVDKPAELVRSRGERATVSLPAGRIGAERAAATDGATGAHVDGDRLVIDTAATGSVLTALAGLGVDLDGVQVTSSTLEDVYLELTGEDTFA